MTDDDYRKFMLQADMTMAMAQIGFVTAQANNDLHQHGEWRRDYAAQLRVFQANYDEARQQLKALLDRDQQEVKQA
jgi:hypothetical protein